MTNCAIYRIWNEKTCESYIGSAFDYKKRWRDHKRDLRNNSHRNILLQNAWNIFSEKSFTFEVLIFLHDRKNLLAVEQQYIDRLFFVKHKLYNLNFNVCGFHGRKHSLKTKRQMSLKRLGISLTKGEKNPNAKLNWLTVDRIRDEAKIHNISYAELGRKYGVSYVNISAIIKNKIWKKND